MDQGKDQVASEKSRYLFYCNDFYFLVIGLPVKHSPNSLQLWFTRLALLLKLGQYETAQIEAEPFGMLQNPDVFFDFYPDMYNGKKGSMASFSFRLLLAEMPIYGNNVKTAMDRLTEVLSVCSTIRTYFQREGN